MEQALEKGKKEAQETIARNLLDVLDDQTIAQKTGLTPEDISRLRL